jgi:hypothetical protein
VAIIRHLIWILRDEYFLFYLVRAEKLIYNNITIIIMIIIFTLTATVIFFLKKETVQIQLKR